MPERPPLGNDLFDHLTSVFPQTWGGMPAPLRVKFETSFEVGMAALLASGSHDVPPLMKEFALLFCRYSPGRGNAYFTLLRALDDAGKLSDTAFATLNYDCLLEWALWSEGRAVAYFGAQEGSAEVWKLHGSCNFMPGPGVRVAPQGVTFSGSGVQFNAGIQAVDPKSVPYQLLNTGLYPAMAYYAQGKQVQISEPSIRMVQQMYASAVSRASSVGVVGVRPNVDDGHVWRPLASARGRILFVGSRKSYMEWRVAYRGRRPATYLGSRFDAGIDRLVEAL